MLVRQPFGALRKLPDPAFHVAAQGVELATQTAVGIVAARGLGPTSFGSLVLGLSLAGITSIALLFGSADVLLGAYVRGEERPQHLLATSLRLWLRGSLTCLALAALASLLLAHDGASRIAVITCSVVLCLNGLSSLLYLPIVAHRSVRRDFPGFIATRAVLVAFTVLAARLGSLSVQLAGYLACALFLMAWRVLGARQLIQPFRPEHDERCSRAIRQRSTHVGVGALFGTVAARTDMLLLAGLSTPAAMGMYGACYRVINGLSAAAVAISGGTIASLHRAVRDGAATRHLRWFLGLPALAGLALMGAAAFGEELVNALYGASFLGAARTMRWLLLASGLQVFSIFLHKWLIATHNERALPPAQSVSAFVNVALNLWLIPRMGAAGAALATLVSEAALLATHFLLALRRRTRADATLRGVVPALSLAPKEASL